MSEQFNLNNRYQFMGLIGKGRLGDVYRSADNFFRKEVALKILHKETATPEFIQYFSVRYAQQIAVLTKLNHPAIIKTYDFTALNNVPAWTMDLFSGASFTQYAGTKLPVEQAATLLIPVSDALTYAHQYGIFHGNLKPSNILIGNDRNPVLTDFGLTQWLSEGGHGYGQFEAACGIGSPEYLAPEQGQGYPIDARTDVYSLAIIFYELITGRRPFAGMSPQETMSRQISEPLPAPRYFVPNISQQAEQFLFQATAKNPMQRISSMSEFGMMLRSLSNPSATGTYYPPASYYNNGTPSEDDEDDEDEGKLAAAFAKFKSNKKAVIIAIVLLLLAVIGIIFGIITTNHKKTEARNAAATQEVLIVQQTQTAMVQIVENQHKQTQQAEQQIFFAQTQEALNAEATQIAMEAFPTPEPVLIPTLEGPVPTAVSMATGKFQSQTPMDGTKFIMGQAFNVVWTMENTGSINWGYNFKLVFDGGTNFTADNITEKITAAEIWPGGAAGITLPCIAPNAAGTYTMQWHVEDDNGNLVFTPLTITIEAIYGELTATPTPNDPSYVPPTATSEFYMAP